MMNPMELPALPGRVASMLPPFNVRRVFLGSMAFVLFVVILVLSGEFFEQLDAEEIMVIQAPLSGELTWYRSPGVKWRGFGKVTKYPKRFQYWFSAKPDTGDKSDQSIQLRFNDGGHANLSGSIAVGRSETAGPDHERTEDSNSGEAQSRPGWPLLATGSKPAQAVWVCHV